MKNRHANFIWKTAFQSKFEGPSFKKAGEGKKSLAFESRTNKSVLNIARIA